MPDLSEGDIAPDFTLPLDDGSAFQVELLILSAVHSGRPAVS